MLGKGLQNSTQWIGKGIMALLHFAVVLLYSGQADAQGTWTTVNNPAPDYNGGVMLLLTDGTVIAKTWFGGYGSTPGTTWDKLTPDSHGSYVNGTWSATAQMNNDRLYFASWILNDGRVYVGGGEYGSGTTGETYNPCTNSWSVTPAPGPGFSDGSSENLPDGRLLLAVNSGSLLSNYFYDPAANTYTTAPPSLANHDEVTWLKLPDSSILQINFNATTTERYIPSLNTWVSDAAVPVTIFDAYAYETGAAMLLPDGRGFFVGATGHTAFYTPSGSVAPGTWTAGPDLPDSQSTPDAPMAMMSNGKILMAVSPLPCPASYYPRITSFYEFDYLTGSFTRVGAPTGGLTMPVPPYYINMLVLPDGNILVCDQADFNYYVYTPGSSPIAAGKPEIDTIEKLHCDTFMVTGKMFTGISEGSAYGDDWSMSTNYPIVRLTSGDNVYYARSFNWNRVGSVMTGALPDTAKFTLPYTLAPGIWSAQVIVNGNPSNSKNLINVPGVTPMAAGVCQGSTLALTDSAGAGLWSSNNTSVATAGSSSGIISGIAGGSAIISCTVGGCTTMATVTVNALPSAITGTAHVCPGSATTLSATPSGGSWSSSNTALATVDPVTGIVTGVSAGTITISYSVSGCKSFVTLTINPLPAAITGTVAICAGSTTILSSSSGGGSWSSANTAQATVVAGTGKVTGVAAGSPAISYTLPTGCYVVQAETINPLPSTISGSASVCLGSSLTLSATPSGGAWGSNNILIATIAGLTGIITTLLPGTATITYTLPTGCKSSKNISVDLAPSSITGANTVCVGSVDTLANGSAGGTWTSGSTGKATVGAASGIVTGVSSGTANITYTLPGSCRVSRMVTVNPLPAAITGTATVCAGSATTLADGTTGGLWSSGATGIATVGSTGLVTSLSAGTAAIGYLLPTGCSVNKMVTVNPLPDAIGGSSSVCVAATSALTNITPGGTWSSGSTAIATVGSVSGIVTGVAAGTVTITYSTPGCGFATKMISVNPVPAAITGATLLCAGSASSCSDAAHGGVWSSSNVAVACVGSATGTVTGISAGSALITYNTGACGSVTTTITINPLPAAISTPGAVCTGAAITMSDSTAGGAWSSSNTSVAVISPTTGIVTGISAGAAVITYASGCGIATTAISVNPIPSSVAGLLTVCSGSATILSDTLSGGVWSSGNTGVATTGSSSGMINGMSAGSAVITYTATGGCTTTVIVTVNASPGLFNGTALCIGSAYVLSDTGAGIWTSGNTGVALVGSSSGIVTGASAGTSVITYTTGAGCYTTATVTVSAVPSAITGVTSLFPGSFSTLGDSTGGGVWSSGNPSVAMVDAVTGTVTGLAGGLAVITYTLGPGCIATALVSVSSVPAPVTGDSVLCQGSTVSLTDPSAGGTWTSSNTSVAAVGSSSGIVTGIAAGVVAISYTVYGTASTLTLTVIPVPAPVTGSASVCAGLSSALINSISGGEWSSSSPLVATVGSATGMLTGVSAGTVIISYSTGCGTAATQVVTVNPTPSAGAISGGSGLCVGSTLALTDTVAGGAWTAGSSIATVGSTSGIVIGVAMGAVNITYTVTNIYSCSSYVYTPLYIAGVPQYLYTYGGTGANTTTGDGGPACLATMQAPRALATDTAGNLYFCDAVANKVRMIGTNGYITTVAGNGVAGNTGDGGPATAAELNIPGAGGLYIDNAGNIFIASTNSSVIRKVNGTTHMITTIAGTGVAGYSGDGGPATAAKLNLPLGLTEDTSGNLYISDQGNNRIRKIDAVTGIISLIAGQGANAYAGDGVPATNAWLSQPRDVVADKSGNLYIVDAGNDVIRKYVIATGIITTIAGTPRVTGSTGDGGPATAAKLNTPARAAFDGSNKLYIADQLNFKIRQLDLNTGIISTAVANGTSGYSGDGGPSLSGQISGPTGVAVNKNGHIFIADAANHRIRLSPYNASVCITLCGPASVSSGTPVTFTAHTSITASVSYQWQKNGMDVSGATNTTYTNSSPANGDVYRCILAVTPECGSTFYDTSNCITITVASSRQYNSLYLETPQTEQLSVYPNPFSSTINISAGNIQDGMAEIHVTDQVGKPVLSKKVAIENNHLLEQLDLKLLPAGLYIISLLDDTGKATYIKCIKTD